MPRSKFAWLQTGAESLGGLIFPTECVWCGNQVRKGQRLCEDCQEVLASDFYHCKKCATPLPSVVPNEDCVRCRREKWRFSRVVTLGPYRGRRREAVILIKKASYEGLRQGLAQMLATKLQNVLNEEGSSQDSLAQSVVVPVPNYWTHPLSGTANTAMSLACAIGRETGIAVNTRAIRKTRKTSKQGMLSWAERRKNVRGAFQVRSANALTGRHVLLVDDVLTSGATAGELASRIVGAGASRVTVVVVARGTGRREAESATPPSTHP